MKTQKNQSEFRFLESISSPILGKGHGPSIHCTDTVGRPGAWAILLETPACTPS